MSAREEEVRPAGSRPGPKPTVRRRVWQPDPRNVKATDRHIRSRWGDEYTWRRWNRGE